MVLAEQVQTPTKAARAVKAAVVVVAAIPAAWVVLAAKVGSARVAVVVVLHELTLRLAVVVTAAMVML